MHIKLEPDIFTTPESLTDVLILVRTVEYGQHSILVDEIHLPVVEGYLRQNVPYLAEAYIDLTRKGVVDLLWTGTSEAPGMVRVRAANLGDVAHDVGRPAVLVLEDRVSDGDFVRAVSTAFGTSRVMTALDRGWLEFRHGGGERLQDVAVDAIGKFRHCIRVATLLDSDRLVPGERTRAYDKKDQLEELGSVVHVLELREIENYVPNRVLAAMGHPAEVSRKIGYLKLLTSEQRGVYDMKRGFGPEDQPPRIAQEQLPVFSNLGQEVLLGLRGGFGRGLTTHLAQMAPSLKEADFHSIGVNVAAEIRDLLQKIAAII